MKSVWSFFVLFLVVYAILAALLAATGLGFEAALVAAASALGNAGPAYDLVRPSMLGESPSYPEMAEITKWILVVGMVLGRLELLALVALFSREQWQS